MYYKALRFKTQDFNFTIKSKIEHYDTVVTSDELPEYLGCSELYEFFQDRCLAFVENAKLELFSEVNQIIGELFDIFYKNNEKFQGCRIDLTNLMNIFLDTDFYGALLYAVENGENDCVPNCAAFICMMSFFSDDFVKILSQEDFILPLTNFYMEFHKGLSLAQKWNVACSINNLIEYYQDKEYSVFFDNKTYNIYEFYDAFEESMDEYKLLKLFYIIIENSDQKVVKDNSPVLFNLFTFRLCNIFNLEIDQLDETENIIQLYNNTFILLYCLLRKDKTIITIIFKSQILNKISTIFIENHDKLYECVISYYSMIALIIDSFYLMEEYEDYNKDTIFDLINREDINLMLENADDPEYNEVSIDLINSLIEKQMFEEFFDNDQKFYIISLLFDLINESSFGLKKKIFKCLDNLIRSDFYFYADTILKNLNTSIICDFIESDDDCCKKNIFSFINFVLTQPNMFGSQDETQRKSFALLLHDDDDLIYSIQEFNCPSNKELEINAQTAIKKIFFWLDTPYDSMNTMNDNCFE